MPIVREMPRMEFSITTDMEGIAQGLRLPPDQVRRIVELLDEGYSIPYLVRYRRQVVGALREDQLHGIREAIGLARHLNERKQTVLKAVAHQQALTAELEQAIRAATGPRPLEDLYLPFKRRKKGRSDVSSPESDQQVLSALLDPAADVDVDAIRASLHSVSMSNDAGAVYPESSAAPQPGCPEVEASRQDSLEATLGRAILQQPALRMLLRDAIEKYASIVATKFVEPEADDGHDAPVVTDPSEGVSGSGDDSDSVMSHADSVGEAASVRRDDDGLGHEMPSAEAERVVVADDMGEPASSGILAAVATSAMPVGPTGEPGGGGDEVPRAADSLAQQRRAQRREARRKRRHRLEAIFRSYFRFRRPLAKISPCELLDLDRGERVRILELRYDIPLEKVAAECQSHVCPAEHPRRELLQHAFRLGLANETSVLARELQRDLCDRADRRRLLGQRIKLRRCLMRQPTPEPVLAVEPQIRRESTLVALDSAGKLLSHQTLTLSLDEAQRGPATEQIKSLLAQHGIKWVVLGDSPGCRDVLQVLMRIQDALAEEQQFSLAVVRAAGTAIWARGGAATKEFAGHPDSIRRAVVIGRRFQRPLEEFLKLDVGKFARVMFDEESKSPEFDVVMQDVARSCVAATGVDANQADMLLLRYVPGLNPLYAQRIELHRKALRGFSDRQSILTVEGIDRQALTQALPFLRIRTGVQPLDATPVHPDDYPIAETILQQCGLTTQELAGLLRLPAAPAPRPTENDMVAGHEHATPESVPRPAGGDGKRGDGAESGDSPPDLTVAVTDPAPPHDSAQSITAESDAVPLEDLSLRETERRRTERLCPGGPLPEFNREEWNRRLQSCDVAAIASSHGVDAKHLEEIRAMLQEVRWDPWAELQDPVFRSGPLPIAEVRPLDEVVGCVSHLATFGAFIDLGGGITGLLHVSRMADDYVADPRELVDEGEQLRMWVQEVELKENKISLSLVPPRRRPERSPPRSRPVVDRGVQKSREQRSSRGTSRTTQSPPPPRRPRRPPAPVVPITDAMKTGRAPMRTFSDLAQFFQHQKTQPQEPNAAEQTPPAPSDDATHE